MTKSEGREIAIEICKILDLQSDNIHSLNILLTAGNIAEVVIERYLENTEIDDIKPILEKYNLVPKEETDAD